MLNISYNVDLLVTLRYAIWTLIIIGCLNLIARRKLRLFYSAIHGRINNNLHLQILFLAVTIFLIPVFFNISGALQKILFSLLIIVFLYLLTFYCLLVRVSNNMVYHRISHKAYMDIKDLSEYRSLDYINHRKNEVSYLVKKEFIEGIKKVAVISPGSPIYVTTHKWIVNNVFNSLEVQKLYEIKDGDKEIIGSNVRAHNMLLLIDWRYIFRHRNDRKFVEGIFKKRDCFKIKLTAKHK